MTSASRSKGEDVAPVRVQLRRTKGWRMPANTVKVDRTTAHGNPYKVDGFRRSDGTWEVFLCTDGKLAGPPVGFFPTRREAVGASVELFRGRMTSDQGGLLRKHALSLRGKNLACWCPLDAPCHADVLLELANAPAYLTDQEGQNR